MITPSIIINGGLLWPLVARLHKWYAMLRYTSKFVFKITTTRNNANSGHSYVYLRM